MVSADIVGHEVAGVVYDVVYTAVNTSAVDGVGADVG